MKKVNKKGQFFVISVIIIMLSIATMMTFLTVPFGITLSEIERINSHLISAEGFMESLETSRVVTNSWAEMGCDKRVSITFYRNESTAFSGFVAKEVTFNNETQLSSLRIYDGLLPLNFSYRIINDSADTVEIIFPLTLSPISSKQIDIYYSDNTTVTLEGISSNDFVYFNDSDNSVSSRFYTAKLNLSDYGNARIYSFVSKRTGQELASNLNETGLINFFFSGFNQTSPTLETVSWTHFSTGISEVVEAVLSNSFDFNATIRSEFFENFIRISYLFYDRNSYDNAFGVKIKPSCNHNWTLELNNTNVTNFCGNDSSFDFNKTIQILSFREEGNDSFAFLMPSNKVSFGNFSTGIYSNNSNHSQQILTFSNGTSMNYNLGVSSSTSSFDVYLFLFFDKRNITYANTALIGLNESIPASFYDESMSSNIDSFRAMSRSIVTLEGVSTVAVPSFKDSITSNVINNKEFFTISWTLFNSSEENESHFDYVSNVKLINNNRTYYEYFPFESSHTLREGSVSSFTISKGNIPQNFETCASNFEHAFFNKNIKNFNSTTPVIYSLYNPTPTDFNVTLIYGGIGTYVNYSIRNPYGSEIVNGSFTSSVSLNVSANLTGFYDVSLQSSGSWETASSLNINTTLSQMCLNSSKFSFSGNQEFLIFVPNNVEDIIFTLNSTGSGSVYHYSLFNMLGNELVSNTFSQGEEVTITAKVYKYFTDRILRLNLSNSNPAQQISWMSVSLVDGLAQCIGSSERQFINAHSPEVHYMWFVNLFNRNIDDFRILSDDKIFVRNHSESVFWNASLNESRSNKFSLYFNPANLTVGTYDNWLHNWTSSTDSGSSGTFYGLSLFENGSLFKTIRMSSLVDDENLNYYFRIFDNSSFIRVVIANYSKKDSPITVSLNLTIDNDDDRWYRYFGSDESEIFEGVLISSENLSCSNGYTFAGKKNDIGIFGIVVPCHLLQASNSTFAINRSEFNVSFSRIPDVIDFYLYADSNNRWTPLYDFLNRLNDLDESERFVEYDWSYSSSEIVID